MAKISNDQIEAIKAEFKKFDTNNDNKLSKKEYYIMLRTDGTNLNEKHIKSFFFALQPDVKGAINFDDLVNLLTDVNKGNTDKLKTELKKNLFKHYDRNHDGSITLKEFKKIAHDFDLEDDGKIKELFDRVNGDDNKITSDELIQHMGELFGF